jgi:hypothetical protein
MFVVTDNIIIVAVHVLFSTQNLSTFKLFFSSFSVAYIYQELVPYICLLYVSAGINSASGNYFKYWRTDFMYVHVVLLIIWGIYLRKCLICTYSYIDYEGTKIF